jgi:hypothetical protein
MRKDNTIKVVSTAVPREGTSFDISKAFQILFEETARRYKNKIKLSTSVLFENSRLNVSEGGDCK